MKRNNNIIKIFGAIVIIVFASLPSAFGLVNISNKVENVNNQIEFQAINIDETTIEITVNLKEFEFDSVNTEQGMFSIVKLPHYGFNYELGIAKLPSIKKMIEIPQESDPEISVKSLIWEYTTLNELDLPNMIFPSQQSVDKIPEPSIDFVMDEVYYSTNLYMPENVVKIVETGQIRSRRFALVEISPIQYKPATGELKLMSSCEISVNLPNSDMIQTYENIQQYSSPSYEKIFGVVFQNYGFYEEGRLNRNQEGFLIITYDDFYDEIQPLIDLKEDKEFEITVKKTSQIPGGPTKENIFDYIKDAYDSWNVPPTYVLLVGDTLQIPTFTGQSSNSEADLYYVTVDGSDYFPDIHIGRFPGSQESHIETMVDKTVYYETGSFPSNDWIKKGAFIASSDQGQLAEQTHNYVIDNFLAPNDYVCDKIYEASGGSTSDIFNSLNDGRSLCIYSGHGSPSGWGCVPFDKNDVGNLENEGMYPFVCSHACSTNTFSDSECFGETWLREEGKGGIGFWGASASTYWDEDDILEKAMFQAWWEDGLGWIGGMTDMGLFYLYENYSGGGRTKYYYEAYNVNGDPSVRLWTDDPSKPPETPTKPDGPDEWIPFEEVTFSSTTTDPDGDSIYYLFDWGDGNNSGWVGPYASGQTGKASYIWHELSEYQVKVMARDTLNTQSEWSEPHTITIIPNEAPGKPTVEGPVFGILKTALKFTVSAEDPEGHEVYYTINWGDGQYKPYDGPYSSGEEVTYTHAWSETGDYIVIIRAKDQYGAKSPQTTVKLTITKNRAVINPVLIKILESLIAQFPLFGRLLNIL